MADYPVSFTLEVKNTEEIKKKFEDAKKGLEDIKKAAEDASKPLDDTAKSLDDLSKSAGDVDKDLDDTAKTLDDVSKSAGDISKDLDAVNNSFGDISKSAGDASSDLKDADSAFNDIASNADGAVSSMDAVKSTFEGISESAVEADQNIQSAVTGLEGVGTATESAAAGADALATSLDNIAASAQEAETNISAAANGIDGIGTSVEQSGNALDGLGSAFDGAGTAGTSFNDVLSSTDTRARDFASGGLTPLNTVLGEVGGATQQAAGGFQGFNSSLGIMTGFIGTAASGAIQFVSSLNNLHGAQIKVEAQSVKLSSAIEAEDKARKKLNDLLESGTATTEQIAQAELDLEQAHARTAIATERAGKAQDDLNIKYAKFATDTLPSVIQTVTSTIGAVSQLKGAFGDIGKGEIITGLEAVGGAAAIAVAGFKGLEVAIKAIEGIQAQFNNQSEETVKKQKEVLEAGKSSSVGGYIDLIDKLFGVSKGLDESLPKAKELDAANKASAASAQTTAQAFDVQSGSTKAMGSEISLTGENVNQLNEVMGKSPEVVEKLTTAANSAGPALAGVKTPIEEIKASIEGARAGIDNYVQGIENQVEASETLKVKLHEQNEAATENIQQTNALVGSSENYNQALLGVGQSIADHNVKIDQLNQTLNTSEGQFLSYANAVGAGNEQFLQWVQTTRDAAVQAETFKGNLEAMANTFGGLPGFMEGTVEEYQAFIRANTEGGEAVKEFERMALESWRSLVSEAEPLFNDLKEAWTDVFSGESIAKHKEDLAKMKEDLGKTMEDLDKQLEEVMNADQFDPQKWQEVTTQISSTWQKGVQDIAAATNESIDPLHEVFDKLPPAVAATLDETERSMLIWQAKVANIAEQAGDAWADNLLANANSPDAIQRANQAVADLLAPFIAEHPELAATFDPLFDAMNQMGPGSAQGVQEVLEKLSGMPGPAGEVFTQMKDSFQEKFAGKIPGLAKTGVEGAITDMTQIMSEGMNAIVEKLNTLINTGIKQDPGSVPEITANTNPANEAIQLIGTSLDQMKQYLTENPLSITVSTEAASASLTELTGKIDAMAGKNVTITVDTGPAGIAIQGLQAQLDAMAGKNVTITVDIGPAGIAITQLQGQIDAVHGKNVTITVDTGPAGIAITQLQSDIDAVHGKNVTITVDTGAAGIAIREIQQQIDQVHGTNVYITVDTSGAQAAIQQLQQQINSLQQSMGGIGGGYTPGYQSPYGSYQGAYGSPYGYAAGFGPAVINRPTRMLVGEAGPEMVSVIPMKGTNRKNPPRSITAATGMGWYGPSSGGLGMGGIPRSQSFDQLSVILRRQQEQNAIAQRDATAQERDAVMSGSEQGTQQGMQQGMPGMQQAVQQGVQDGMQQGYQQAPSRIQAALQAGNMAEAFAGFGMAGRFGWTGSMGTSISPGGLGGGGGGAQYPMAPSDTSLFGTGTRFTWMGGKSGTQLGGGSSFYGGGMMPSPFGGGGGGRLGPVPGSTSFGGGAGGGAARSPGVYTGQVPASYGKPLGQLINGIAATILPGQGPIRQAGLGMHERLKKDTMIQAHKNEYVDIGAKGPSDHPGKSSGVDKAAMDRLTQLLERLITQGQTFKVDFNVDGRKLSSVASKNMGVTGYGDK